MSEWWERGQSSNGHQSLSKLATGTTVSFACLATALSIKKAAHPTAELPRLNDYCCFSSHQLVAVYETSSRCTVICVFEHSLNTGYLFSPILAGTSVSCCVPSLILNVCNMGRIYNVGTTRSNCCIAVFMFLEQMYLLLNWDYILNRSDWRPSFHLHFTSTIR